MNNILKIFGGNLRQFGMLFALIALVIFFQYQTGGLVLNPQNMMNIISGNSYVLILAIGMVLVIIAGHIDLSVGSVAAFVGIVVAIAMRDYGVPPALGFILGILLGIAVGAWQGFWVAYMGVPAFIVTLAGMLVFRGLNQWVGASETVPVGDFFIYLGAGYLPSIFGVKDFSIATMVLAVVAILFIAWNNFSNRRRQVNLGLEVNEVWVSVVQVSAIGIVILGLAYLYSTGRPETSFPVPGIILVVLAIAYSFLTSRTVLGRHVYAVGGNKRAAELSGVSPQRTNFFVMANNAMLAAIAGMIFIGRSQASGPSDGVMWELDAIASVFIGGAAVSGGVGTVGATMVGGLVMAVLNNGLQLMSIGADLTQIIKGLVLLFAVVLDVYSKQQGKPSIIGLLMRNFSGDKTPAKA